LLQADVQPRFWPESSSWSADDGSSPLAAQLTDYPAAARQPHCAAPTTHATGELTLLAVQSDCPAAMTVPMVAAAGTTGQADALLTVCANSVKFIGAGLPVMLGPNKKNVVRLEGLANSTPGALPRCDAAVDMDPQQLAELTLGVGEVLAMTGVAQFSDPQSTGAGCSAWWTATFRPALALGTGPNAL